MNIAFAKQYVSFLNTDSEVQKEMNLLLNGVEPETVLTTFSDEVQKQVYDFLLDRCINEKGSLEVSITTWENDGDDYSTQKCTVPNVEVLNQLLYVLEMFAATTEEMGNEEFSASAFVSSLVCGIESGELTRTFIKEFFQIEIPRLEGEELEEWADEFTDDDYVIIDCLHELLGTPVSYDYDFCRIVDEVVVKDGVSSKVIAKFEGNNWCTPQYNWKV